MIKEVLIMTKKKEDKKYTEELDQCVSPASPEMSRSTDSDEPCNDNRA